MKYIPLKDLIFLKEKDFSSLLALSRWFIHYVSTFIFIYLIPNIYKLMAKSKWRDLWVFYRIYAKISLWGFGVKLEIDDQSDTDLDEQFIMVSNHRSWLDQVCLLLAMKQQPHFFTKSTYLKIPILGKALSHHQPIPVTNGSISDKNGLKVKKYLKQGDSLLLYLEGTRGQGRSLLPFRFGAFKYASETNIPILPIFILGSEEVLSKRKSLLALKPGFIKVIIGKPKKVQGFNLVKEKQKFEKKYKEKYYSLYDNFHTKNGVGN